MVRRKMIHIFVLWQVLVLSPGTVYGEPRLQNVFQEEDWQQLKDKHFVVHFQETKDKKTAQRILREAERYYQNIGAKIGFTRYGNFWTWEQRVNIYLFPDRKTFSEQTGQPEWSTGYVNKDSYTLLGRVIVTYRQDQEFFDGLLPHEIGHLILHDFIPDTERIPMWFDEGIAQLYEAGKSESAFKIMRSFLAQDQYIPLEHLMIWDIQQETDPLKVAVFYAQSLSIVEFLIKKHGSDAFGRLCRQIRDGRDFESALQRVYPSTIKDLNDLERKWISFMKQSSMMDGR